MAQGGGRPRRTPGTSWRGDQHRGSGDAKGTRSRSPCGTRVRMRFAEHWLAGVVSKTATSSSPKNLPAATDPLRDGETARWRTRWSAYPEMAGIGTHRAAGLVPRLDTTNRGSFSPLDRPRLRSLSRGPRRRTRKGLLWLQCGRSRIRGRDSLRSHITRRPRSGCTRAHLASGPLQTPPRHDQLWVIAPPALGAVEAEQRGARHQSASHGAIDHHLRRRTYGGPAGGASASCAPRELLGWKGDSTCAVRGAIGAPADLWRRCRHHATGEGEAGAGVCGPDSDRFRAICTRNA